MGHWPLLGDGQRFEAAGVVSSSSGGVQITSDSSVNSKGSYVELISSTGFDASGLTFLVGNTQNRYDALVDIAIGAAGSEQVIISNYLIKLSFTGRGVPAPYFPISIPAGTRIAARWQLNSGLSQTARLQVLLHASSFIPSKPLGRITTYGADITDSGGVTIDPGGTANTKGSYVEITSSTTNPIKYLILGFGSNDNNSMSDFNFLFDIAIGSAGSEQILLGDVYLNTSAGETIDFHPLGIPCHIPAGTRIAVRSQCDGIDATDRLLDIALYGVD